LSCRSPGRVLVQPLVTRETQGEEFVAWPTDRGYLNIGRMGAGRADRFAVKYRLETDAGIAARPAYLPPDPNIADDSGIIYGASRDGFVHAIRERDGQPLWRFSAGEPILQPVVVIDDRLYVATQLGGMYCLSAQTGSENWWTPQISQFVAASQQRVYAADKIGRIATLDAKTGARLDVIPAEHLPIRLLNTETDRLYLATRTGLIQCLHELEQSEPIRHGQARKKMAKEKPPTAEQEGIGEPGPPPEPDAEEGDQPGGGEDPFAPGKPPLGPPGGGNDGGADEDPFADGDSDRFD
jgi:hypothetical protein